MSVESAYVVCNIDGERISRPLPRITAEQWVSQYDYDGRKGLHVVEVWVPAA